MTAPAPDPRQGMAIQPPLDRGHEVRCEGCSKLLGERVGYPYRIVCQRCKTVNDRVAPLIRCTACNGAIAEIGGPSFSADCPHCGQHNERGMDLVGPKMITVTRDDGSSFEADPRSIVGGIGGVGGYVHDPQGRQRFNREFQERRQAFARAQAPVPPNPPDPTPVVVDFQHPPLTRTTLDFDPDSGDVVGSHQERIDA